MSFAVFNYDEDVINQTLNMLEYYPDTEKINIFGDVFVRVSDTKILLQAAKKVHEDFRLQRLIKEIGETYARDVLTQNERINTLLSEIKLLYLSSIFFLAKDTNKRDEEAVKRTLSVVDTISERVKSLEGMMDSHSTLIMSLITDVARHILAGTISEQVLEDAYAKMIEISNEEIEKLANVKEEIKRIVKGYTND